MTKRTLFFALCDIADAMQQECGRMEFSLHTISLNAITDRVDVLIDQVLEEGVQDDEPPRRQGVGRWVLPPKPEEPR